MISGNPYETMADEYEAWFEENDKLFAAEAEAIRQLLPEFEKGIEIGVGTGLFAHALGITEGAEPTAAMRKKAQARGIRVIDAFAEKLPIAGAVYDVALMVTVDCFLNDVPQAYRETRRILKDEGVLIVAFLDRASPLGEVYERNKMSSPFYANANCHSAQEVRSALESAGFEVCDMRQTVFSLENKEQEVKQGTGEGVFAVLKAKKKLN